MDQEIYFTANLWISSVVLKMMKKKNYCRQNANETNFSTRPNRFLKPVRSIQSIILEKSRFYNYQYLFLKMQ